MPARVIQVSSLAGGIPRFRSAAKGEIDHGAYKIDGDITSSSHGHGRRFRGSRF
jgi:hypothetical protein